MKNISLYKEFGNNILTRSSIDYLFRKISELNNKYIIIDFKNVKFISRSSAAEYLKLKEKIDKALVEQNMSDEVKSMFNLVVKQLKEISLVN